MVTINYLDLFSPIPSPIYFRPVLNNETGCSSTELLNNSSTEYPITVFKLTTLNMAMTSMPLYIPSFPRSDIGLIIYCGSITVCSEIFSLCK